MRHDVTAARSAPIVVCHPFAGDMLGGSHHSVRGLLDGLDRTHFEPLVVLEKTDGRLAEHFAGFRIAADPAPPRRSVAIGQSFRLATFLRAFACLPARVRFLRRNRVAIVHGNDGRSLAAWALAARLAGAKLVWHHRGNPRARGLRWLAPLVSSRLVAVSRFALPKRARSRVLREARVVFSPFDVTITVDRGQRRAAILGELGLANDTVLCGYFGLINARKRPLAFVAAVLRLRELVSRPVVGLIFGEVEDPATGVLLEQRLSEPGVAAAIRLMGYRSPGADWIAGCDLLPVTAVEEPLGRTLIEAMVVGTPVVATMSGGNAEAILDGLGVLVPPDDAEVMAQACAALLADPGGTAAIAARARQSACTRFAQSHHVETISALYEQLAGRSKAPFLEQRPALQLGKET